MRYTPEQQQDNRQAILTAARKLFKEKGFGGVGIDAIAAAAGLTSGALYSHFSSKQALFEAILEAELLDISRRWLGKRAEGKPDWLDQWITGYLSTGHQHNVAAGCVLPSLSVDAARSGETAQRIYEELLLEAIDELEKIMPDSHGLTSRERVWGTLALLAGGIMLARATRSKEVAVQILQACRKMASRVNDAKGK